MLNPLNEAITLNCDTVENLILVFNSGNYMQTVHDLMSKDNEFICKLIQDDEQGAFFSSEDENHEEIIKRLPWLEEAVLSQFNINTATPQV